MAKFKAHNPEQRRRALRAVMRKLGLSVNGWATDAGVSEGTIRNFLKGGEKGSDSLSDRTYTLLAQAVGMSVAELQGEVPKRPSFAEAVADYINTTLPVSTLVGAGDDTIQPIEGDEPIDEEAAPPDMLEGEVTEVRGRSMLPVYGDGDRLFHRFLADDPSRLIGLPVVARLKDGRRFVKILQTGSRRGRYDLVSINPQFPTLSDQAVDAVAEIVWVKKRAKRRAGRG